MEMLPVREPDEVGTPQEPHLRLMASQVSAKPATSSHRFVALRIAALVLLTLCLFALSRHPQLKAGLTLAAMRERLLDLGRERPALSLAAYVASFCLGELLHVPGIVFIVLGELLYGRWPGFGAAYLGALCSVCFSFVVVRTIGGQPINEVKWRWAAALLDRLHDRPVVAVAVLRLALWVLPPLNYLLAMSQVGFWDHALGSALGLFAPVLAISLLADILLPWLDG